MDNQDDSSTRFKVIRELNEPALNNHNPATNVKEKFEIIRLKKNSLGENSFNLNETKTKLINENVKLNLKSETNKFITSNLTDNQTDNLAEKSTDQIKYIDDDVSRKEHINSLDSVFIPLNRNESVESKNNNITHGNRVKFSNDTTPLLLEESRNHLTKNVSDDNWIDENGLVINKTISKEKNVEKSSKAIKVQYDRENKSLEFVINLGNKNSKEHGMFTQLKFISFYQALIAEFLGTYILILYVCGFGLAAKKSNDPDIFGSLTGSLASGLIVSTAVWGFGHVSGANFNPAVTLALLAIGETNIIRVLLYITCQLLGSIVAVITLKELFSPPEILTESLVNNLNVSKISLTWLESTQTLKHNDITEWQGFGIEALVTFILVLTVFACIDNKRKDLGGSFPLTIGFSIVVGALFAGKFTGGSMNPARTFGPAFVLNKWENHWIYWCGPITGAIIAAYLYKILVFKTSNLVKNK